MPTPEQLARQNIDALLAQCGWIVQSRDETNLGAGRGIAVREFPLKTGYADYLLFVDRRAIGAIEAKAEKYSVGPPVSHSSPNNAASWPKWNSGCRWCRNSKRR